MKRLNLFVFVAFLVAMWSCGGSQKKDVTEKAESGKSNKTEVVNKKLVIKVTLANQVMNFDDGKIMNNAMTPDKKSAGYTIYAGSDADGLSTFDLEFTTTGKGQATNNSLTIKGYDTNNVIVTINKLVTEKGAYGSIKVTSINGTFSGKASKLKNGFPTADTLDFSGSFTK